MSTVSSLSLFELDGRIAILRDNIRQLVEQAAAFSGAGDEERAAARIAQQNDELQLLLRQREALLQARGPIAAAAKKTAANKTARTKTPARTTVRKKAAKKKTTKKKAAKKKKQ